MPNYNLGVAYGSIKITSDNAGAEATLAALNKLRAAQGDYGDSLRGSEKDVRSHNKALQELGGTQEEIRRRSLLLRGAMLATGAAGRTAAVGAQRLAEAITPARVMSSVKAYQDLQERLQAMTTAGGALKALRGNLLNVDAQMANMPRWVQNMSKVAGGIVGAAAAGRGLQKALQIAGPAIAGGSAMMFLRNRGNYARLMMMGLAGSSGIAGKAIRGVATAGRTLGAGLGLAVASSSRLQSGLIRMGAAGDSINRNFRRAGKATGAMTGAIVKGAQGVSAMALGGALVAKSLQNIGRTAKFAAVGIGALGLGAAAISVVGTTILGIADAAKQLSGAALIVPGALFSMALAGGVAAVAFKGVKEAFTAAGLEGEEFDKATEKMSPVMKDVAKAAQPLRKEMVKLKDNINDNVWAGFSDDIKTLGDTYMPVLTDGTTAVGKGLNQVVKGFTDFAKAPATVNDTAEAFQLTGRSLNNVARAIWPVMSGLRDVGMVGMETMTGMTAGAGAAGKKFGDFMAQARYDGSLDKWLNDGLTGFKDLGKTIGSISSGTATFFKAFGSDGENALERMRVGAQGFQSAVEESAQNGSLKTVVGAMERMGDVTMNTLRTALTEVGQITKDIAPFAEKASEAMGDTLAGSLGVAGAAAQTLAKGLSLGDGAIGSVAGGLLGLALGAKLIKFAATPAIRAMQGIAGVGTGLAGAVRTVGALGNAVTASGRGAVVAGQRMGGFGTAVAAVGRQLPVVAAMQRSFVNNERAARVFAGSGQLAARAAGTAGAAMTGLRRAGSAAAGVLGGPASVALIAVAAGGYAVYDAMRDASNRTEVLARSSERAASSQGNFLKAFQKSNGVLSEPVYEQAAKQVSGLKTELQETSGIGTGWVEDLGAAFKDFSNGDFNVTDGTSSKRAQDMDIMAGKAKNAAAALNQLGMSDEELGKAMTGSAEQYRDVTKELGKMGEWGRDAVDKLAPLRQAFVESEQAAAAVGPANMKLANGLEILGTKGATTSEKVNGLTTALEGLGLRQTTEQQAAFAYQQTLADVGTAASQAVDYTSDLGDGMLDSSGKLDATSQNARSLNQALNIMADGFFQAVASGENAQATFDGMGDTMSGLGQTFGLAPDKIAEFTAALGVVPSVVTTLMQVVGSDEATQELTAVASAVQAAGGVTEMRFSVQSDDAIAALEAVGATVTDMGDGTISVTATADQAQQVLTALQGLKRDTEGNVQIDVSANDAASPALTAVQSLMNGLNGTTAVPTIGAPAGAPQAGAVVDILKSRTEALNNVTGEVTVGENGVQATQGGIAGVVSGLAGIPPNTPANVSTNAPAAAAPIGAVAGDLGAIPASTPANVSTNAGAAAPPVGAVASGLAAIPANTNGNVTITGAEQAAATAGEIAASLANIVGNVTATVSAPGLAPIAANSQEAQAALSALPASTTVTVSAAGLPAVAADASAVASALAGLPANKTTAITATGLPAVAADAQAANSALNGIPGAKTTTITATGLSGVAADAANAASALNSIPTSFAIAVNVSGLDAGQFAAYAAAVSGSMQQCIGAAQGMAGAVQGALAGAAAGASGSGAAVGAGFAAGIRSQVGAVAAAAAELAAAASAPLPNSPAKIGPFSGRGWTPFRGKALGEGFAQGISNTVNDVKGAAMGAAQAASAALNTASSAVGGAAGRSTGGNNGNGTSSVNGMTTGSGFGNSKPGWWQNFSSAWSGLFSGWGAMQQNFQAATMGGTAAGLKKSHGGEGDDAGNVLKLLDKNRKTISQWHENASWDKQYGGGVAPVNNNTNNNKSTGVENMNIYAGPGQDPYQLVESAMFQVSVSAKGKY